MRLEESDDLLMGEESNRPARRRWEDLQGRGRTTGPALLTELDADRVIVVRMRASLVVLGLDRDLRAEELPVQRREDCAQRRDPDCQAGDKTISDVSFPDHHDWTLERDRWSVNGSISAPRLADGMGPDRACVEGTKRPSENQESTDG